MLALALALALAALALSLAHLFVCLFVCFVCSFACLFAFRLLRLGIRWQVVPNVEEKGHCATSQHLKQSNKQKNEHSSIQSNNKTKKPIKQTNNQTNKQPQRRWQSKRPSSLSLVHMGTGPPTQQAQRKPSNAQTSNRQTNKPTNKQTKRTKTKKQANKQDWLGRAVELCRVLLGVRKSRMLIGCPLQACYIYGR